VIKESIAAPPALATDSQLLEAYLHANEERAKGKAATVNMNKVGQTRIVSHEHDIHRHECGHSPLL
jgi:hypothetical protein